MAFTRYFEIFLDTKKGSAAPLLAAKNSASQADKPNWIERDNFTLRVWFIRRGAGDLDPLTSLQLEGGDNLIIVGRPATDVAGGDLLFSSTVFTLVEDGEDSWYECALDLAIQPLLDAVAATGTNQLQVTCQIQDQDAPNTSRYSFQFPVLILASGITGSEGVAEDADPPYPLPQEIALRRDLVEVVDATERLALTTDDVLNGDHVREVGRAEITKLTCLGSTYAAAVAEVIDVDCAGLVAASLAGKALYLQPDPDGVDRYELFWFQLDGAGSAPGGTGFIDGVDANFHAVAVTTGMADTAIAESLRTAIAATALFTAVRTGASVRVTWVEAGPLWDAGDFDSGAVFTEVTTGADAAHTLSGTMLTLYGSDDGPGTARTVGFSIAGDVGDIPITLGTSNKSAADIATLVRVAVEAHADFTAAIGAPATTEVTVTNATKGPVTNASAGGTGFTVTVLAQGVIGAITYVLVDETLISSEAGWNPLPVLVGFLGTGAGGGALSLASNVWTKMPAAAESWDTHFQFDPTLSRFTCKVPGRYVVSAGAIVNNSTATYTAKSLVLYKNGAFAEWLAALVDHAINGSYILVRGSAVMTLAAGDFIEPYVRANKAGTVDRDASSCAFSAIRLGA